MSSLRDLVRAYDDVLDNVIQVHERVQMDTPEDIDLHARAVAEFRKAQTRLREARDSAT